MTPQLLTRLRAGGLPVGKATALSNRHAEVYLVELEDGRRVNLRSFPDTARAEKVAALLKRYPNAGLPRLIHHRGRHVAVEFIEGVQLSTRLSHAPPFRHASFVRDAGVILARLHRRTRTHRGGWPLSEYSRLLSRIVLRLRRKGFLGGTAADRLIEMQPPNRPHLALTHGDLCPENMVIDRRGRVRPIDIERLAIRPIAFDLARTIQRWPLDDSQQRTLIKAYDEAGGAADEYLDHRLCWQAIALATSASYRMIYDPRSIPGIVRQFAAIASAVTV